MQFKKTEIYCEGYGRLNFRPAESCWNMVRESVRSVAASGTWGEIAFHQLKNETYLIVRLFVSILEDDTTLSFTSEESLLQFVANMKQDIPLSIAGATHRTWRRHDFNLCYLPSVNIRCTLRKGEYEVFAVEYSMEYLRKWNTAFPMLENFLHEAHSGTYARIAPHNPTLTPRQLQVIHEMLNSGCSGHQLEMFLEAKVLELLRLALARATERKYSGSHEIIRPEEMKTLQEAREHLFKHFVKPPTAAELAFIVGMSQSKLRKGFSKLYGCTMFEFITDLRMQEARRMVTETDVPFKVIAITIGLKSGSGFSTRFKKSFGVSPESLRGKK